MHIIVRQLGGGKHGESAGAMREKRARGCPACRYRPSNTSVFETLEMTKDGRLRGAMTRAACRHRERALDGLRRRADSGRMRLARAGGAIAFAAKQSRHRPLERHPDVAVALVRHGLDGTIALKKNAIVRQPGAVPQHDPPEVGGPPACRAYSAAWVLRRCRCCWTKGEVKGTGPGRADLACRAMGLSVEVGSLKFLTTEDPDTKVYTIFEGTSEIQRLVIAARSPACRSVGSHGPRI